MLEVIVLSDDEAEPNVRVESPRATGMETNDLSLNFPKGFRQDQKKPYKLVLVDSQRCPQMPRPRFLPIGFAHGASPAIAQDHHRQPSPNVQKNTVGTMAEGVPSATEMDNDEKDSDYEDTRPLKRRRTGMKKIPKRHGRLTAPDWEVVRNGDAGIRTSEKRPIFPARPMSDKKEARAYVKRLTADVDWEDMLRHLERLRLKAAESAPGENGEKKTDGKARRGPSQANILKQYWQNVLMKTVLKMHVDHNS